MSFLRVMNDQRPSETNAFSSSNPGMAETGVAGSMAAGAFAACMGASLQTIEQAAEIGIEHNLGLTVRLKITSTFYLLTSS